AAFLGDGRKFRRRLRRGAGGEARGAEQHRAQPRYAPACCRSRHSDTHAVNHSSPMPTTATMVSPTNDPVYSKRNTCPIRLRSEPTQNTFKELRPRMDRTSGNPRRWAANIGQSLDDTAAT